MKSRSKRPSKKQLRAIQTSRHLHVVHKAHTGHITPHRTTSYPVLAMLLLLIGVFLVSWTRWVGATTVTQSGSYTVNVSVPGPPPSQAATIDQPKDGAVFTSQPITVSGTCPVNTYEKLYRNGAFSGVAQCDLSGHYSLITGLFPSNNQLKVRDFSQTDVPGPWSNTVNVTYNPPQPVTPPSTGGNEGNPSTTNTGGPTVYGEPLIFKTNFVYEGHYVNSPTTWELDIEGGNAPYAISVDWGDGQHSLISRSKAGTFNFSHTYKKPGPGYQGSYVTKFSASDEAGQQTFLQLMAIVNNPPGAAIASGNAGHSSNNTFQSGAGNVYSSFLTLMKYIWPSYFLAVLLLVSFWLGERREYERLKPRLRKARHA